MDINKILSADILDIIFDGRNKEYGAYELRKTYNTRMRNALFGMLGFCAVIAAGTVLAKTIGKAKPQQMVVKDVQLQDLQKEEKKVEPPPPPPPKTEPPKVEIKQFTPPKIVKEVVQEPPPKQEELEDTKIGTINQEGEKTDVVAPPVEEKGTAEVPAPKVDEEDYDRLFTKVEQEAEFPGGAAGWTKYLTRNLNGQVASDNGAAPGNYRVVVTFTVDKQGNISDVQADNDPGYGMAAEAMRVIKKGPAWKPANQNGHIVTSRKSQPVIFQVSEE